MTPGHLADLAEDIAGRARARGADDTEAFVRSTDSVLIEVRDGVVEGVRRTREISAALRVIKGGSTGFAFATQPVSGVMDVMAEQALAAASLLPPVPGARFSNAGAYGPASGICDRPGLDRPHTDKVEMVRLLESAALASRPSVTKVHKPFLTQRLNVTALSGGGRTWTFEDTVFSMGVEAVAEAEGSSQTGYDYRVVRRLEELDPSAIGQRAGQEADGLLGASAPVSGRYAAVFPPKTAVQLLGILLPSFSADEMQKGRSRLADRRGQKMLSSLLTIRDDGSIPGGVGSVPFDDERVPPLSRNLVDRGVLRGCLHTLRTAARWGEEPTGNGFRGSASSIPSAGSCNLFVEPGPAPVERDMPGGTILRVEFLMGVHTADSVTGDFSLGAAGTVLEGQERIGSFGQGTISGNIFELLSDLAAVGNDLTFFGSTGSPSLLVGSVIVSGR